jgi:hypothetical protein
MEEVDIEHVERTAWPLGQVRNKWKMSCDLGGG